MATTTCRIADIEVSVLCLGTMTFGNPVAQDDAIRIVHWSLDHGINFIDTADMYEGYDRHLGSPGGVAETILGEALKDRREQAIVTTKVGNPVGNNDYSGQGLSRNHIVHQIDASLARLRTDYVDFYELHCPDPETSLAETIEVMAELIKAGKIRHWGFSNFSGERIHEMWSICDQCGWPRPVISQPALSWLNREELDDGIAACVEQSIAVTPYRPLQAGLLTGKYRRGEPPPADSRAAESAWLDAPDSNLQDQLDRFEAEAVRAGRTPTQHAVRWVLDQQGITSLVIGTKWIEQLSDLLDSIR